MLGSDLTSSHKYVTVFAPSTSLNISALTPIRELERLVGRLTLENEILKKTRDLDTKEKKDDLSIVTSRDWKQSKGGAR